MAVLSALVAIEQSSRSYCHDGEIFQISGGIRGAGNSIDYLLGRDRDREGEIATGRP